MDTDHTGTTNTNEEYKILTHAIARKHIPILIQLLELEVLDINATNESDRTPLMYALLIGNTEAAMVLLAKGADVNRADKNGFTALMYAVCKGNLKIVEALLGRGANVNRADENGTTALMHAVHPNSLYSLKNLKKESPTEIIDLLVKHDAILDEVDKKGKTALRLALEFKKKIATIAAKFLLEHGADPNKAIIKRLKLEHGTDPDKTIIKGFKPCIIDGKIVLKKVVFKKITNNSEESPNEQEQEQESLDNNAENNITSNELKREKDGTEFKEPEKSLNEQEASSGNNAGNSITGNELKGQVNDQDSSKKAASKLTVKENSDNKHGIMLKIKFIEEFLKLPEFVRKIFTDLNEIIENISKKIEIEQYLSYIKDKFIIISDKNLETAESKEIEYEDENFVVAKDSSSKIPFEFTPEQAKVDIFSLVEGAASANGLLNEIFYARGEIHL